MKIYSMTATFGKLENQTLMLKSGLNVISAPNEWGKTTWCAFLVNMLYGVETRVKSTKTVLTDKGRYTPWSGSPMSGRIDLNWNGRDITIERWTKGRTPMGMFRAYETESGVEVAELTAATCGEMLLGVERSVFLRSAFIRQTDMPVTEDEQLRRRLNALVTTGEENEEADLLAQRLKELKNKCRYNRTGLLPAAEKEAAELKDSIALIAQLQGQIQENAEQQRSLREQIAALKNHKATLDYAAAEENNRRIVQARLCREETEKKVLALRQKCEGLPDGQQCDSWATKLERLHGQTLALDMEQAMLPPEPEKTQRCDFTAEEAFRDQLVLASLQHRAEQAKARKVMGFVGCGVAALAAVVGLLLHSVPLTAIALVLAAVWSCVAVLQAKKEKAIDDQSRQLTERYGNADAERWVQAAEQAQKEAQAYAQKTAEREEKIRSLRQRRETVNADILDLTKGEPISDCLNRWKETAEIWKALERAECDREAAAKYAETVAAMAQPVQKPELKDTLTYPMEQTRLMLERAEQTLKHYEKQHSNLTGRIEAMGQEDVLRKRLGTLYERMDRLNRVCAALELAQTTLAAATAELQRRFAPKIAKEARMIFESLTDGRYTNLTIAQGMELRIGTSEESVPQEARLRSDGTVDQVYLALRLAVSKALMPDVPLVLDDALVRFDDRRHAAAMELLTAEAQRRQIILFTCQQREVKYGG